MATLSADQVVQLLLDQSRQMGVTLTPQELVGLTAIAGRESGYNPAAHNPNAGTGDNSYGLWQINMLGSMGPARAAALGISNYNQLFDPATNARAAIQLVLGGRQQGNPLNAWGGYKGMSDTYNTNMPAAQAAVNRVTGGQAAPLAGAAVGDTTAKAAPVAVNPASIQPYTANGVAGWGVPSTDQSPGAAYLDQNTYLGSKSDPATLMKFITDWITLGNRGIIGGDGKPASYWDVYQDLKASGIDVSSLPTPDSMPQGMIKGGGSASPLRDAPPSAQQLSDQQDMTTLLQKFGISYPNAPQATPGLLAYLRGVGMTMSTAEDVRNAAVNRIQTQTPTQVAEVNRQYAVAKQNLTGNLQQRGVLSSGEANTRYANQQGDVNKNLSDIYRAAATGVSGAETTYTQTADQARQQALQQVLSAETQQGIDKATSAAQAAAYQQQADATAKNAAAEDKQRQDYYNTLANVYTSAATQGVSP